LTISAIVISAAKMIGVGNDPGHSFLGKAIYHMIKRHRRRASCAQQHPKQIKAYLGFPIEGDPPDIGGASFGETSGRKIACGKILPR
jgi:hypothetical protein